MEQLEHIFIQPALGDNYIYLAEYAPGRCFAVDPGDASVAAAELDRRDLQLTHIFATHHHADHIGGVGLLKKQTHCEVVGPDAKRIGGLDTVMGDGDTMALGTATVRCISTPGHTATSVCYTASGGSLMQPVLFSGDTLFVCGCGRVFDSDYQRMYASLQKLTALGDDTLVYPGHDYTEENVEFALIYDPDNDQLEEKLMRVQNQSSSGRPTVPSTLGEEKQLNPFLKAGDWQTFAALRQKKDVF